MKPRSRHVTKHKNKVKNKVKNGQSVHSAAKAGQWALPLIILGVGAVLFWWTATNEALLVDSLFRHPWPLFENFMSRSIYEGEGFGGSDFGVTIAIVSFLIWITRRRANTEPAFFSRKELKFLWLSSVLTAFVFVHSLKWVVSRSRPKWILNADWFARHMDASAMAWPGFMPFDGPRGLSWNSFPSGHTASCAIMLSLAYVYYRRHKGLGVGIGVFVAFFCGAMAVARSMAGMHWLSDSVVSFFSAWAIVHILSTRMRIHSA
jgi:membrane-associated phospholipid phosphatase